MPAGTAGRGWTEGFYCFASWPRTTPFWFNAEYMAPAQRGTRQTHCYRLTAAGQGWRRAAVQSVFT